MKKLFYLLFILGAFGAKAQQTFSVNGTVTDDKGVAIPGTTIFITNSKYITSTNSEGKFNFDNIKPGTYELVFKMLGFTPGIQSITVQGKSVTINPRLTENSIALKAVTIKSSSNNNSNDITAYKRSIYLNMFANYFIGQTVNAELCTLLNPNVLHFSYDRDKDILTATADDFIIIENKALGYNLKYLLSNFQVQFKKNISVISGSPYFEELKGSESQQKKWEANRKLAYLSSSRHFFRAVMNNTAKEEGYLLYRFLNVPANAGQKGFTIIRPASIDSLFADDSKDFKALTSNTTAFGKDTTRWGIYIVYTEQKESPLFFKTGTPINLPVKLPKQRQISELTPLAEKILIDNNGGISPSQSLIYAGYWGWERAADLTPLDYSVPPPPSATGKLRDIAASLDTFTKKTPLEKVHIQTDKPYYSLNDTLWLKAYIVNERNEISTLSHILYVDLLDYRDSVKTSLTLPLSQGLGWGALTLSDSTLSAGNYHIRAYTNRMRNFGGEYFFNKEIKIGGGYSQTIGAASFQSNAAWKKATGNTAQKAEDISVKFFPEGGELVDNVASKIGFKAIGADGVSREITGYIVDKDNTRLTTFRSEHAGMGTFILQPDAANTYTAVVKLADSSEKRIALPKVLVQGYSLSVNQSEDNIIVSISATKALLKNGEVTLVGQANNIIKYTGKKDLSGNGLTTMIPKSRFPEGIVQFTLFSPDYQPVAERLIFNRNPDKHLNIKITPDKPGYNQRDKVHLDLEVTDQQGTPVSGSFALAVTNEVQVPYTEAEETTIFSNLLLTADLKGYIEHPNYYFADNNADKDRQLDNLLLTQGWRRFVWQDIMENKLPTLTYQPETGIGLSGRVLTNKGLPVAGGRVYILFNTPGGTVVDTVTNADGRFNFENLTFNKGISYNVAATDAKGKKNVKIELDKRDNVPPPVNHIPEEQPLSESFTAFTEKTKKQAEQLNKVITPNNAIALNEVTIKEKRKTIKDIALQGSKNFRGWSDFALTFVDLAKANDIGVFLSIQTDIKITHSKLGGWGVPKFYEVYLDGEIVDSVRYNAILPGDIAAIEIVKATKKDQGWIYITLKKPGVNYQKYIDENQVVTAAKKEDQQKQAITLKEVIIQEKRESQIRKIALQDSKNPARPELDDAIYTFVDLAKATTVAQFLRSHLDGVHVNIDRRKNDEWTAVYNGSTMEVVVDGYPRKKDFYSSIPADQIAAIEVTKGSSIGSTSAITPGGTINITLKHPGSNPVDYNKYIEETENQQRLADAVKKSEGQKAIALKEVTIQEQREDKIKKIALQNSENPMHNASQVLTFVDLENCSTLNTCLAGKANGIIIKPNFDGSFSAIYQGKVMTIIIEGGKVNIKELNTITPNMVAAVEIVKSPPLPTIFITLKTGGVDYQKYVDEDQEAKHKSIMLKEITIKEKKLDADIKALAVQYSTNLAGPGHADQVLTFIDLLGCQSSLAECLAGRLLNVKVVPDPKGFGSVAYSRGFDTPMLIVVDGVAGRSLDEVTSSDVASVEVLRGGGAAALYGVRAGNGVLIITTKKGGVDYLKYEMEHYVPGYTKPLPKLITYHFQNGYDTRRQFYSPDYDNPATNRQMADQRTTIYWNPNIVTDSNGKASVDFFNSDGAATYRVITEGLDGLGKLGRQLFKYQVK